MMPFVAAAMAIPFEREFDAPYEQPVQVSPLISRLLAHNPSPFTFKGTGVAIIGKGQVAVIDPGPDDPGHLAALRAALDGETVTHILVTHTHRDHSPAAKPLKAWTGAPTMASARMARQNEHGIAVEEGGDRDFVPDIAVRDGDVIAGWVYHRMRAHARTYLEPYKRAEGRESAVHRRPCHGLVDERGASRRRHGRLSGESGRSCSRAMTRSLRPTHGGPVRDPGFHLAYLAHRLERERQILTVARRARQGFRRW
jgi:hypothetical protein